MTESIRVTFCLLNSGIGGTELNAVRTAERLDRERFELDVVCLGDDPSLRERYEAAGIPVRSFRIRSLKGPEFVRQGWRLRRHLRSRGTQVFHSQDSYGNILGVPWARLAGVPTVLASQRWWKSQPRPGHARANRVAFRLAHGVVTNTPAVRSLLAAGGIDPRKVRVVPNFVDEESFLAPRSGGGFRREFGIPEVAPLIGIVAQLRPEKDHATLLRAMADLHLSGIPAHLVVVGEGACRPEIERLRAALGLEGCVHMAGLRRPTSNIHHQFDVSVLTSTTEAMSNSVLEAMAAGNPVVATEVGGNADLVRDGENGFLVPVGGHAEMARALGRLLTHEDEARRLGANGARRARSEFTAGASLRALEKVYMSSLAAGRWIRETAAASIPA